MGKQEGQEDEQLEDEEDEEEEDEEEEKEDNVEDQEFDEGIVMIAEDGEEDELQNLDAQHVGTYKISIKDACHVVVGEEKAADFMLDLDENEDGNSEVDILVQIDESEAEDYAELWDDDLQDLD